MNMFIFSPSWDSRGVVANQKAAAGSWYESRNKKAVLSESDTQHNLRKRRHNLTLPEKKGHLAAKNFIVRLLYKETY